VAERSDRGGEGLLGRTAPDEELGPSLLDRKGGIQPGKGLRVSDALLRKLEDAFAEAEEKQSSPLLVVKCKKAVQPATVRPFILPAATELWFTPGSPSAASGLRLGLVVLPLGAPYAGGGILHVGAPPNVSLFRDALLANRLVLDGTSSVALTHAELAAGLPLWVQGSVSTAVQLTLTLDASATPLVQVLGPATAGVMLRARNVVTPHIAVTDQVQWFDPERDDPTAVVPVSLSWTQTQPSVGFAHGVLLRRTGGIAVLDPNGTALVFEGDIAVLAPEALAKGLVCGVPQKDAVSGTLTLRLQDPGTDQVRVEPEVSAPLTIRAVNVVRPVIDAPDPLWFPRDEPKGPGVIVKLSLTQTNPEVAYAGGGTVTRAHDPDLALTTPTSSTTPPSPAPKRSSSSGAVAAAASGGPPRAPGATGWLRPTNPARSSRSSTHVQPVTSATGLPSRPARTSVTRARCTPSITSAPTGGARPSIP
jgi:hypothetical protein